MQAGSRGRSEPDVEPGGPGRSEPDLRAGDQSHALAESIEKGEPKLVLHGMKLQGRFLLVRTRSGDEDDPRRLIIKMKDEAACEHADVDPLRNEPWSALSGLWVEDLVEAEG